MATKQHFWRRYAVAGATFVAGVAFAWYFLQAPPNRAPEPTVSPDRTSASDAALAASSPTPKLTPPPVAVSKAAPASGRNFQFKPPKGAAAHELTLQFPNDTGLQAFLAKARKAGVSVLGVIPQLNAVRVAVPGAAQAGQILALAPDNTPVGYNNLVSNPKLPNSQGDNFGGPYANFGSNALSWLGVTGDASSWGSGVTVAVLDTGVNNIRGLDQKTIPQYNLLAQANDGAEPDMRHGTAMASIIAGDDPTLPGIAQAAQLLSLRVLDESGGGDGFTVAQGIIDAVDRGARVLSMSMGSPEGGPVMDAALNYALTRGVAIVAATGNDGLGEVSYPANYPGVIGVTAVDANGQRAQFANYGAEVALAAPGVGVSTPWTTGMALNISGTSASVPFVSGAIAAVMSNNPGLSPQAAANLLIKYADDAGAPGPDPMYGAGILDLGRVMNRNTPNLNDAAVADIYYSPTYGPGGAPAIAVTVQNRGTTALANLQLDVTVDNKPKTFYIGSLVSGDIQSETIPLSNSQVNNPDGVTITSQVSVSGIKDVTPGNNSKSVLLPGSKTTGS